MAGLKCKKARAGRAPKGVCGKFRVPKYAQAPLAAGRRPAMDPRRFAQVAARRASTAGSTLMLVSMAS